MSTPLVGGESAVGTPLVGGESAISVLSVLAAAHSSSGGLLPFFSMRECRTLVLVHREFLEAVHAYRWADDTRVDGSLEVWRKAFPCARVVNISSRADVDDAALAALRGVDVIDATAANVDFTLEWEGWYDEDSEDEEVEEYLPSQFTDAGLAHLKGVLELSVRGQVQITDAGITLLKSVRKLDVVGCEVTFDGLFECASANALTHVLVSGGSLSAVDIATLRDLGTIVECVPSMALYAEMLRSSRIRLNDVPTARITSYLCAVAVQHEMFALEHVPAALKTRGLCLFAMRFFGRVLHMVPDAFKDAEMCRVAVENSGDALRHVPSDLRTRELCLVAAETNGWAIKYMRVEWITEAMCIDAVAFDYYIIEHVPEALLTDNVICAALAFGPSSLRVLSYAFVRDRLSDAIRAAAAEHGVAAMEAALAAPVNMMRARSGDGPDSGWEGCCVM